MITFKFDEKVEEVYEIGLLNIDRGGTTVFFMSDNISRTVNVPNRGPNSVQVVSINDPGVKQVKVTFSGEGAVTFISFCSNPGILPPSPTLPASPTRSPQPSESPSGLPTEVPVPGRITGIVFEDTNGNGVQDPNESGIPNVEVVITDSEGDIQIITTNRNGRYSADVPPGPAVIDIDESTLPPGYLQTAGTDPTTVVVPSGGTATDQDGYQILPLGKVKGVIFEDINGDGTQDPNEPGIEGVDVVIFDTSGRALTLTTDEDGMYMADVPAGPAVTDIVESTLPPGAVQTTGTDPTPVSVPEGGTATDLDGFQLPVAPTPPPSGTTPTAVPIPTRPPTPGASPTSGGTPAPTAKVTGTPTVEETAPPSLVATGKVSGIVFLDVNGNGEQDDGEPGIPNVDVVITDSTGDVITLTTDETGMYMAEVPIGSTVINIDETALPPGSEQMKLECTWPRFPLDPLSSILTKPLCLLVRNRLQAPTQLQLWSRREEPLQIWMVSSCQLYLRHNRVAQHQRMYRFLQDLLQLVPLPPAEEHPPRQLK
jgi:uncharacterized protein (DUF2141 family)